MRLVRLSFPVAQHFRLKERKDEVRLQERDRPEGGSPRHLQSVGTQVRVRMELGTLRVSRCSALSSWKAALLSIRRTAGQHLLVSKKGTKVSQTCSQFMAPAPRAQREVGGLGATRTEEPPDSVKGSKLLCIRRSPKFGGGSPLPPTEDVVKAHGDQVHPSFEHEALKTLLCQPGATSLEDAWVRHRKRVKYGRGGTRARPLQVESRTQKSRKLGLASGNSSRETGKHRAKGSLTVEPKRLDRGCCSSRASRCLIISPRGCAHWQAWLPHGCLETRRWHLLFRQGGGTVFMHSPSDRRRRSIVRFIGRKGIEARWACSGRPEGKAQTLHGINLT